MKKSLTFLIFVLVAAALCLVSCQKSTVLTGAKFYNMRKIAISVKDKEYLLESARAMLEGKRVEKKLERHPLLFKTDVRGAFLILPRNNEFSLCTYGQGEGIFSALEEAVSKMKRLARHEDLSDLRIRIELIDESTDSKTYRTGNRLKIRSREMQGLIFETEPIAAFLPDEIIARNIIDHKGKFYRRRLREVVNDQFIGKKVYKAFDAEEWEDSGSRMNYSRFTRIGFMEPEKGDGIEELINGRPAKVDTQPETLMSAVLSAGEYLKSIVKDKGELEYIYYPNMNRGTTHYNLRRHAATCYAMLELYELTGDAVLLEKTKSALNFLVDKLDGPSSKDAMAGQNFKALYTDKETAKTGSAGLMIVALAKYMKLTGDQTYLPVMRDLGQFILFMTQENGHLIDKYYKSGRPMNLTHEAIYYPGECALGMTRLYQIDKDQRWLDEAEKLVDYLILVRDKDLPVNKVKHDDYLCICLNELYPLVQKTEYKEHAYKVGQSIFDMMRKKHTREDWVGSFFTPPSSLATATRNEAIQAVYALAKSQGDPTDMYYEAAQTIAKFQLRMQYTPVTGMFLRHPDKASGGFPATMDNPEIRIDYVAHNLSSLLGLWKIEMEKGGKDPASLMKAQTK